MDSLDTIYLVIGIEDEFDIEILDSEVTDMDSKTPKAICDLVENKLKAKE